MFDGLMNISPERLRAGDLIVDDADNVFAEVASTVTDPGTGSVWVSPVPCASTVRCDIEFPPGTTVTVLAPRPPFTG